MGRSAPSSPTSWRAAKSAEQALADVAAAYDTAAREQGFIQ
jgi:hypothetical protein